MRSQHRSNFDSSYRDDAPIIDGTTQPFAPVWETAPERKPFSFRTQRPRRDRDATARPRSRRDPRPARVTLAVAVAVAVVAGLAFTATSYMRPSSASIAQAVATGSAQVHASATKAKHRGTRKARHSRSGAKSSAAARKTVSSTSASSRPAPTASRASATSGKHVASSTSAGSLTLASTNVSAALKGSVVVIDAGHQAHGDSSLEPIGPGASQKKAKVSDGASGPFAPHAESQINLDVALKLRSVLQARGVKVIMVRTTQNVNIANSKRAAIANKAHAALFIRLHCDGISDSSKHGFSTLIPAKNRWTGPIVASSAKAGRFIQSAALKATGAANAGIVNRGDLSGFNWSKVPTVLVEMGFMSNRAEDRALTTAAYQQRLANGLANGVVEYLKSR